MKSRPTLTRPAGRSERGVALLISLFALVLISGVAAALIVMSGNETAIAENYRSSTQAFYAAYAGLEEARGRLRPAHPNSIAALVAPLGGTMAVTDVLYILNPAPGETVQPTNLSPSNAYRDTNYQKDFGAPVSTRTVQTVSTTSVVGTLLGPLYKWVRINPKTEASSGVDMDGDGVLNNSLPVFYNGARQSHTPIGRQVLTLTTLAVMPNGSRKILQYDVAPVMLNLSFPAALTMDGRGTTYWPANSNVFWMDGNDHASCGLAPQVPKPAVGVISPEDDANVTASIPANRRNRYIGTSPNPSIEDISALLDARFQTVASLEKLLETIRDNATQVIQGPATSLPDYGSPAAPTITFVQGDLTLSGDTTGYGILVVTGGYTAQGTVGWRGIVLVVGQGEMTVSGGGNNEYDGAVLLAKTRNPDGTLRATLGPTTLDWAGGGGNGVYYDSCWVANGQSNVSYRVLAFREVDEDP